MPLVLLLTALIAPGCQDGQSFRSLSLAAPDGTGPDQATAFAASREVLSQYFSIDSADPATGQIVSRPRPLRNAPDTRISATPARELAVLRLRSEPQGIIADIRVAIQRSDAVGARLPGGTLEPRDVPNQTPAEEDAPLTSEQLQAWRTTGYDHQLEQRILRDLYNRLHPQALTQPASQP
jgi:hypothetical protein